MRVGLVCPYSLGVPGGVQNHVRDLAEALSARGHQVAVLAPGEPSDADDQAVSITSAGRAVPVSYNGSVARLAFGPRVAARTRRWLDSGRFDVLHVHEPMAPSVSLLALRASDTPVVATFHTALARSRMLESAGSVLAASLNKVSVRIAVSEAARATLVQHVGGDPVVIPNGIFCDRFVASDSRGRPHPGRTALVFLGRIDEPRKGLSVVLEAFARMATAWPDTDLLIAGRGKPPALESLPSVARDRIHFLGPVSDDERTQLLASAAIYVAPHISGESFGIVLLEAMAAGAPVAASDLPAFAAVLEGGRLGPLFATGDAAAAARVISRLLADPQRRAELGGQALQAVRAYDWSVVTPRIEAVYRSVAG